MSQAIGVMGFEVAVVLALVPLIRWARGQEGIAMGPFELIMNDIRPCEGVDTTEEVIYHNIKRHGVGRSATFDVDIELKRPYDDDVSFEMHFGMWKKEGFKKDMIVQDTHQTCKAFKKYFPDLLQHYLDASNITDCPIPPGHYEMRGVPNKHFKAKHIQSFIYGKIRADIIILKAEERIGCVSLIGDSVPQKRGKKGR